MNSECGQSAGIDLAEIRERLSRTGGQEYWRSLEEAAATPQFTAMMHREFPAGATEWADGVSRRNFLRLATASLALAGITACTRQPTHKILPYVKQPQELVPGEPLFYASAMVLGGYATGVLVKSYEGHPVKIEGNPEHPASLGASSIWMQASLLDLYDPDRSQAVTYRGELSTWDRFLSELNDLELELRQTQGAGLRFLTETVTSPSLAGLLKEVVQKFPAAKWHQFEPVNLDHVRAGARLAFGEVVDTHYRFDQAGLIVALDSDFLYTHPERLGYTRQFTDGRRLGAGKREMNRLYVFEPSPTITGSMADHRVPVSSGSVIEIAHFLAHTIAGLSPQQNETGLVNPVLLRKLAGDLAKNRGQSIVLAGEGQPPEVHALAHWLNDKLGNAGQTVYYTERSEVGAFSQAQSLAELAGDMEAGKVQSLFVLSGNPVMNAPANVDFAGKLQRVARSIHLSAHMDETSLLCTWHLPQTHYLESWGDARSFDGTVSLQQPLIAPLYGGKTASELLGALLQQQPIRSDYELLREFWERTNGGMDFELRWRRALHDGFIRDSRTKPKTPTLVFHPQQMNTPRRQQATGLEVCFRPDPNIWDGRFANNGWLQECPKPISKLTWDNAALISPRLAQQHRIQNGDMLRLSLGERTLECPAWIMPGQAERTVTLHLGYGRSRAGRIGNHVGFNTYALRTSEGLWSAAGLQLTKTGRRHELVATQTHHSLQSPERQIYRAGTLEQFLNDPQFVQNSLEIPDRDHTLYHPEEYAYAGYKWGMSIDLTTCIGCNACVVACEAENNIPVVGKREVARHREMLWLRVDTYYHGSLDNPEFNHMPVPCMHCEHAPCELVCPVAATVHDHEGLNLQVYNRCVGTRFCSNNCPYKVRRFNFFQYAKYSAANLEPMYNPDVTVRWRGVMEKCTYCLQRISAARIAAEKENRKIGDGEVKTACQQACPAKAIVFGDLNDLKSRVAALKKHPLDYAMLGELNTRPRTTYLAKVINPATTEPEGTGTPA